MSYLTLPQVRVLLSHLYKHNFSLSFTDKRSSGFLTLEQESETALANGVPTKILIKCENIKRILPNLLSMGSYQGIFGTSQNTASLLSIYSVRMDRRQTMITITWTSSELDTLFGHLFKKTREDKGGRKEVNAIIEKIVGKANRKLNAREGKTRAFIAQQVSFRKVPRVHFECLLGPKPITGEESALSDEERKELLMDVLSRET